MKALTFIAILAIISFVLMVVFDDPVPDQPESIIPNITDEDTVRMTTEDEQIVLDYLRLSSGGFVVIKEGSTVIGITTYHQPGTFTAVPVTFFAPITEGDYLSAAVYHDSNENYTFDPSGDVLVTESSFSIRTAEDEPEI